MKMIFLPEGVAENGGTPSRVRVNCSLRSGGLRCAPTTGYYLTAFQAEKTLRFHTACVKRVDRQSTPRYAAEWPDPPAHAGGSDKIR